MRFAALVCLGCLAGCTYDYWPEPRGPRTVCSGTVINAGYYATGGASCQQYPPDPCWNDASPSCNQRREEIRAHNQVVHQEETRDWLIAGGVLVGAIVVSGIVIASQPPSTVN